MGVTNGELWQAGWAFGLYFVCDGIPCGLSFFFFWSTEGRAQTTHISVQDLDLENGRSQKNRGIRSYHMDRRRTRIIIVQKRLFANIPWYHWKVDKNENKNKQTNKKQSDQFVCTLMTLKRAVYFCVWC